MVRKRASKDENDLHEDEVVVKEPAEKKPRGAAKAKVGAGARVDSHKSKAGVAKKSADAEEEEPALDAEEGKKGGKKKAAPKAKADVEAGAEASPKKKAAKAPVDKVVLEKAKLAGRVPRPPGKKGFKVISWNITTLRSLLDKTPEKLVELIKREEPDLIVLQEIKLSDAVLAEYEGKLRDLVPGHAFHFSLANGEKKGYAGTMAIVRGGAGAAEGKGKGQQTLTSMFKTKGGAAAGGADQEAGLEPLGIVYGLPTLTDKDGAIAKEVMMEGRTITVEYESFYVVATYVPNSGDKLQRLDFRTNIWDTRMRAYLQDLQAKKPVIWTGDLNVAHLDQDIWNCGAKHLAKSAGTTPEERDSFSATLKSNDMSDAFRRVGDAAEATNWYTYWSVRAQNRPWNRGLRLDYFVCSNSMFGEGKGPKVCDAAILSGEGDAVDEAFVGIDHVAIALTLKL